MKQEELQREAQWLESAATSVIPLRPGKDVPVSKVLAAALRYLSDKQAAWSSTELRLLSELLLSSN